MLTLQQETLRLFYEEIKSLNAVDFNMLTNVDEKRLRESYAYMWWNCHYKHGNDDYEEELIKAVQLSPYIYDFVT